jgi:hypothetical protein
MNTPMNKNIHHEFAYQSRELGIQIEDTLGEPPDRKYYAKVIASLIGEFAKGTAIDDVNLLSFALADYLRFDDPAGLLAQCKSYDTGDAAKAIAMVSCTDPDAAKALAKVAETNPELRHRGQHSRCAERGRGRGRRQWHGRRRPCRTGTGLHGHVRLTRRREWRTTLIFRRSAGR